MKNAMKSISMSLLAMVVMLSSTVCAQGNGHGKGNVKATESVGGKKEVVESLEQHGKTVVKDLQGKPEKGGHGSKGSAEGKPEKGGHSSKGEAKPDGSNSGEYGKPDTDAAHGQGNGHDKGAHGSKSHEDHGKSGSAVQGHPAAEGSKGSAQGEGHAYGKNKTLEGKEFGQQRAEEARTKTKTVVETAETHLAAEEVHVQSAKDQIKAAQTQVAQLKQDPKADKAVIATKEELIRQIELKSNLLDQQIKAGKDAVEKAKSILAVPAK
jgi:colicin import membrane protein